MHLLIARTYIYVVDMHKHMSQHVETVEAVSKSLVHTQEAAVEALARVQGNPDYAPLNEFVTLELAQECEKYLQLGAGKISHESRQSAASVVHFMCDVENKGKTQAAMLKELGIPLQNFRFLERYWPGFWPFVTLISCNYMLAANHARIVQSTLDAAVTGTHQDRRLYFEAFRGLRARGEGQGGKAVVVFINDSVRRPAQKVDVEVVPLAEGEEL